MEEFILTNGYKLITEEHEMRMQHWVRGFAIYDDVQNRILEAMQGSIHLAEYTENADGMVITICLYPNIGNRHQALLNFKNQSFIHINQDKELPLSEFEDYFYTLIKH